jgi:hypothetical protein
MFVASRYSESKTHSSRSSGSWAPVLSTEAILDATIYTNTIKYNSLLAAWWLEGLKVFIGQEH